jgi:hypothetical protein
MILPSQLSRAASVPVSGRNQHSVLFGHAPKPQPNDTREWLQTFVQDLFMPHKVIPNAPGPTAPADPLADKNGLQKVFLWFQALFEGLFKDLELIWQRCRPGSKSP